MTNNRKMNAGERAGKFAVYLVSSVVDFAALILFMLLLFLSLYCLWDSKMVYGQADASNYSVYKPATDDSLSFDQLRKINPDVFAWLTINDTHIDYPVVTYTDNNKYVSTDAEGNYSMSGALFLDCENNRDFSDFVNVIYGHHMEQGEMFGDIGEFRNREYFDSHKYGNLFFDGKNHGIEIFAYLYADAYDGTIYNIGLEGSARNDYISYIMDNAVFSRDLGLSAEDHILILSTCSTESTNGRYIVATKITDAYYPQKEPPKRIWGTGSGVDMPAAVSWMFRVPLLAWVLILLIIIILLLVLVIRNRKKKEKNEDRKSSNMNSGTEEQQSDTKQKEYIKTTRKQDKKKKTKAAKNNEDNDIILKD